MQYGGKNSKDGRLVVRGEVKDLHGSKETPEVFSIVLSFYSTIPSLWREKKDTSVILDTVFLLIWVTLSQHNIPRKVLCFLPGWDNSRSQPLVDRKPASAVREVLPASHRRCDSSSHLWPGAETYIHLNTTIYRNLWDIMWRLAHASVWMSHLEHNAGLFQKILRGYGTTDHTTRDTAESTEWRGGKETQIEIRFKKTWREAGTETVTFVIYSYSLLQKDFYVLPKATGIIVPHSFGISKRFQQRSCFKYLPRI